MTKNYESGRSMVEMLGTLAIIGVLSIGGIVGYSYGMDKYRANQTVNDVMLRAVDVMTQLSQGKAPDLEPEWGTKGTVYNMEAIQDTTNNTWGIVVDGVPSRVCQMVGDALKNQATVYVGNAERNDTTASDPCESSDENTMEFYFEPVEKILTCDPECPSGEFCRWGECVSENIEYTKWLGEGNGSCIQDSDCGPCASCIGFCRMMERNGTACTINTPNDGMCHWGECLPKGCNDKNPCKGDKEYCASPSTYATSNCKAFYENEEGTCVKADFKPFVVDGKEYWISNMDLDWWDAEAGCKSIDKQLLSVDDLVKDGEKTTLANALYDQILPKISDGRSVVWTSNIFDSCQAYIYDGYEIYYTKKRDGGSETAYFFAVCK